MPRHVKLGSIETITYQPGGYSVFQSALDEYPTVVVGTIAVSFAIGLVGGWLLRGAFR
jgi:NhaP-type Na+/H+ or K+/H+ antiporter